MRNATRHTLRAQRYLLIADYGRIAYWYDATDYSLEHAARAMRAVYPGATIYATPDDRLEADAIGLPIWE